MNNQGMEALFKFIVPAIFVVIWTLNALFNKEATRNAQAPRSGSPLGPRPLPRNAEDPPRPSQWSAQAQAERRRAAAQAQAATRRESDSGFAAMERRANAATAAPTRANQNSRKNNRENRAASSKPAASGSKSRDAQSNVPSLLRSPLAGTAGKPLTLLTEEPSVATPRAGEAQGRQIRSMLENPASVREAIILAEILKPPIALRGRKAR